MIERVKDILLRLKGIQNLHISHNIRELKPKKKKPGQWKEKGYSDNIVHFRFDIDVNEYYDDNPLKAKEEKTDKYMTFTEAIKNDKGFGIKCKTWDGTVTYNKDYDTCQYFLYGIESKTCFSYIGLTAEEIAGEWEVL